MNPASEPHDLVTPHSELRTPNLLNWLSTPAAYPDRPPSVQRVETHISCVFLTDRFAYKLKKAVRFDFLDFSTLPLRHQACAEEVRLNRRLAPQVYLGLVAVRRNSDGQFSLDEREEVDCEVVEWLVKMHRLPEAGTLQALIKSGNATDDVADAIAAGLADFYRQSTPLSMEPAQYRSEIERHVRANQKELLRPEHGLDAAINRIHGAQLRLLVLRPELFEACAKQGCLVDGHGDLRPEHIYLLPDPVIIDCIEFNPEFRHLDWADELSFLATECDFAEETAPSPRPSPRRRGSEVGRQIFERTLSALGDQPPPGLIAFYRSYRACVRAKVAALRARQLTGGDRSRVIAEAQRHLQWADRYDRQLSPPFLVVMSGLMGSGKSTLAGKLCELSGAELLATDAVRQELFGKSLQPAGYGEANYGPQQREQVYDEMFARADRMLAEGLSVVLDGAFLPARLRMSALEIARRRQLPAGVVHCHCPVAVARERIAIRMATGKSASEARPELYEHQRQAEEPNPPDLSAVEIDTTQPLTEQIDLLLARLANL